MGIWSSLRNFIAPPPRPVEPIEPQAEKAPERASRPTFALDSESAVFLLDALGRMGSAPAEDRDRNPFDASKLKPPPGVGPKGSAMAMDDATFGGVASWALEGLAGFLGPREGFIGFPELAILAQRPEYRSPVEIIATEATRKWIKFQAVGDKDKADRIAKIEAEFKRLEVQAVFRQVSEHDGFYGRGHVFVDVGVDLEDRDELKKPIGTGGDDLAKLKIARLSVACSFRLMHSRPTIPRVARILETLRANRSGLRRTAKKLYQYAVAHNGVWKYSGYDRRSNSKLEQVTNCIP
jgi:uncharacterized protein